MLSKKSPVKLFPSITGMLDGAIHPISPNPITFRSLRSQSLSKQVNLPPDACAMASGFLAATGDLTNPETRRGDLEEGEEREEVPRPTTEDEVAKAVAILREDWCGLGLG